MSNAPRPEARRTPLRRRALSWITLLAGAALVVACGGGSSGSSSDGAQLIATVDSLSVGAGESAQLLANDTLGNGAVTAGASGNVSFALVAGRLPDGVTVADGVVTVADSVAPTTVTLTYQICQTGRPDNCAFANATLRVTMPQLHATADSFNLAPGSSADLLANDTLGGRPADASTVTASPTTVLPAGVTLDAAGMLAVDNSARAGTYSLGYRICQVGVAGNCAQASAQLTVPGPDSVYGRVIDASTSTGVAGVRVSVGGLSAVTDANGDYEIPSVPLAARATVVLSSTTHAGSARIAEVRTGASEVPARLLRDAVAVDLPVATGGTVSVPGSGTRVTLPPNAVQRGDGSLPSGNYRVRVTPIDPSVDSSVMPGDYTTLVSGVPTPIESLGAASVEMVDDVGNVLVLRSGISATVRIPVASRSPSSPATMPLYFFDNTIGRWVQEGSATLGGVSPTRYYEGTVSHFTVWSASRTLDSVQVTGCVVDASGVRVPGALVQSDGIDYSGITRTVTDNTGAFTLPIRRDASAIVVASAGGLPTNSVRVGPLSGDTALQSCLMQGDAGAGLTMKLTWGALPSDLDSHLFAPDGSHVYYVTKGSLTAAPYASLDVDDVSSFGPEVVTVTRLMVGTYKYAVHNYSGQRAGLFSASGARVEVNIPGRPVELYTVPGSGETLDTDWWLLFEFDVDANCNVTVRRVGSYATTTPAAGSGAPTYCSR